MKCILVLVACIKGLDLDDDGTNLLQTSIGKHHHATSEPAPRTTWEPANVGNWTDANGKHVSTAAPTGDFDFDRSRWVQLDGYYPYEGHGNTDQLYGSLKEAMDTCDEAGDCKVVSFQKGVEWRVSHQAPENFPLLGFNPSWAQFGPVRCWVMTKAATPRSGSIGVSSATCGGKDISFAVSQSCKGKTDCVITLAAAEEANPATLSFVDNWIDFYKKPVIVPTPAGDFDFDRSRWVQVDGYYIFEGHGNWDACYPTLSEALEKCDAAGNCLGVTFAGQANCKYRPSHQRLGAAQPTLMYNHNWRLYSLRSWVTDSPGIQSCKDDYSVTYSCGPEDSRTATISKPSEGKSVTLSCAATTTIPTTTAPGATTDCPAGKPKCLGVTCTYGKWVCGGNQVPVVCPGTNSPGGETEVTDAECLDAERGFGPDFSCANTEMYCSSDSGDGLTVGACCPIKCKKEFENKRKNSNTEKQRKNEAERKAKRAANEGTRKKNEKERKKKRKDTEWNTKRDAQETKNKNAEEERKNKRGWKEGQRKNERGWKKNRRERRAAADKRERARKETRNKNNKKPISAKACKKNKAKYATCKAKPKCEKKFKKKGRKEPTC